MRHIAQLSLTLCLAPVLLVQALWVISRALRLPEADGPRSGTAGEGPNLRLLIVGDSSAAGVGVATQDHALAGQLVAQLATTHHVTWRLEARTGDTTHQTLKRLRTAAAERYDIAVIALGVNDATRFVPAWLWRRQQRRLFVTLQQRFGVSQIFASGVPPLGAFPLLPQPLRWVLGQHATRLDATLISLTEARTDLNRIDMAFDLSPDTMAEDGFHPGPDIYAAWAVRISDQIRQGLTGS